MELLRHLPGTTEETHSRSEWRKLLMWLIFQSLTSYSIRLYSVGSLQNLIVLYILVTGTAGVWFPVGTEISFSSSPTKSPPCLPFSTYRGLFHLRQKDQNVEPVLHLWCDSRTRRQLYRLTLNLSVQKVSLWSLEWRTGTTNTVNKLTKLERWCIRYLCSVAVHRCTEHCE
jgi:hypothetical protein